jgi:hypothetical protein
VLALCGAALVLGVPRRAPANIQEQRARLPPPALDCSDPVAGTWMSHAYYPHASQWYVVHLDVRRQPGDPSRLVGQMRVHFWSGDERTSEPPPCGGLTSIRAEVREPAVGTYGPDGEIVFRGTSYVVERDYCGWGGFGYALDRYSGKIDPEIMEFQSILDDGAFFRNIPVVFRRIACAEEPTRPPTVVARPPTMPPGHVSGCGCGRPR